METKNVPSRGQVIPVANFLKLYHMDEIEKKIGKLHGVEDNALRTIYERMLSKGPERFQVKPSRTPDMESLYEELPNFQEPLDDIRRQVALCQDSGEGLDITPIFLLGEPGVGKTHFAKKIANLLGTGMGLISMGQMTAGWLLSGSSAQWKGAKPGKVFENLVDGEYANPVLVVDEIDKANSDAQYDPLGSLFTLFEHDTAKSFIDEFANVAIDASRIIWISTANDERLIPKPILNRMNIFEIEKPTFDQAQTIAKNIYASICNEHSWGGAFEINPSDDLINKLAEIGPREMRRALMVGFGNAKLQKRSVVKVEDLPCKKNKKTAIGFIQ